ncbi:hypothetical protein ISS04_03860 [Candidatus Woesearchaeota archaeon]|nr:hypothetical protein [Candidatus Woesearchaeota archaeon]
MRGREIPQRWAEVEREPSNNYEDFTFSVKNEGGAIDGRYIYSIALMYLENGRRRMFTPEMYAVWLKDNRPYGQLTNSEHGNRDEVGYLPGAKGILGRIRKTLTGREMPTISKNAKSVHVRLTPQNGFEEIIVRLHASAVKGVRDKTILGSAVGGYVLKFGNHPLTEGVEVRIIGNREVQL